MSTGERTIRFLREWPARSALLIVAVFFGVAPLAHGDEYVFSDFNGTGFSFTFDNFAATTGPTSVRLATSAADEDPGWGGGGLNLNPLANLSSLADGRWVIDLTKNPANGVNIFTLELYDNYVGPNDERRSAKWDFNVGVLESGMPTQLVSTTTLDSPTSGNGDWQNLDLSQIASMNVLGEWMSPATFDLNFDRIAVLTDVGAPPPYPGMEPDAPWRSEAAARIDAIRKADLRVNVTDAAGNPLPAALVGVEMQQHEFGFGSAAVGFRLRDNNPVHDTYKEHVEQLFNLATLENNLKWPPWNGEWGGNFTQEGAANAIDWLNSRGIDVRGHTLVWPGYSNLPQTVKNVFDQAGGGPLDASEQQQLRDLIAEHIDDIAARFAGQLAAWDVINETRTNHDVMDNLTEGDMAMVHWFQQARAADPNAALYLNDYGILTSGGATDTVNQQIYYDTIEYLIDNGAPIDGIGFQGHFSTDSLAGPEQLWTILDRFEELGLDMQITEFDFGTDDEELQAAYTRDFLTAVFAHGGMDDFVMWGFWEDAHWRPNAAMFNSDWSIKPNGQAYLDLVFGDWWTDEETASDEAGEAVVRAFKGEHEVLAAFGEFSQTVVATLTDGGLELDVALPFLLGDYNRDGTVDAADYTRWRDLLGQSVTPGTLADGDGDGEITANDYNVWVDHFGATMPAGAAAGAGPQSPAVPEPSTLFVVLAAAGCLALSRRSVRR